MRPPPPPAAEHHGDWVVLGCGRYGGFLSVGVDGSAWGKNLARRYRRISPRWLVHLVRPQFAEYDAVEHRFLGAPVRDPLLGIIWE